MRSLLNNLSCCGSADVIDFRWSNLDLRLDLLRLDLFEGFVDFVLVVGSSETIAPRLYMYLFMLYTTYIQGGGYVHV